MVQARTAQASGAATCTVMACVPFDMQDGAGGHGAGKQRRYVHGKIAGAGGHGAGKQRRYMHGKIAGAGGHGAGKQRRYMHGKIAH